MSHAPMKGRLGAAMVMVSTASLAAHAGGTNSWLMPVSGSWNDGTNWSTGLAPDSDDQAEIGLLGAYTVTTTSNAAALSLNITNSDAVLIIDNSRVFDLFGDLSNEGLINVNPTGGGFATQFDFESDATITGSGEIRLGSADVRARLRSGSGFSVTQSAGHTIAGYGQIEAGLINDGLVSADVPNQSIVLTLDQKVNNATMQAVNAGVLNFGPFTLDQGAGGELVADGTDSLINFSSTSVTGGTIRGINGGRADVNNATFDAVTLEGTHQLLNSRTLAVFNSITNNGILTINPSGGGFPTQLDFENSGAFNGAGSVRLASVSVRARLRTAVGATMTNSADHSILGYGQIEAALINDGLVSADIPNQSIVLNTGQKVNNATMQAVNAGVLDFGLFTLNQGAGGELVADGTDSLLNFSGTSVTGGTIRAINGGRADVNNATFDAVTLEGTHQLLNSRTLAVFNSITNNGILTINPSGGGFATQLDFENSGAFNGAGSVRLASVSVRARLRSAVGATMTNSADHSILGYGQIEAALINDGLVSADVSGQELLLTAENKSNNATMQAVNAGILDFGLFTLNQSGPGLVAADGDQSRIDLNSTTIVGGTVQTSNGATVEIQTATLDAVQSQSDMNVLNGNTLSVRNGLVNNGTIVVNSIGGGFVTQISWLSDDPITGDGSIVLNSSDVRARLLLNGATRAELGSGQHLSGIGLIQAPLLHHGTIAPGLGVGTMFASSPVEFSDSSVFEAEVSGSGADLLDSSSTVQLDGTLEVVFVDGFTPAGFWARTIIEGSGITEKFDAVVVPAPAPGLVTRVLNTGSAVIVGQTCPSDTNLDGALNFFDVSAFLNAFQAMDPIADLTGDGQFNFFDVSAFLNNFGSGCGL